MRAVTAAIVVVSLLASAAFANTKSLVPLPSGKPASVKQAELLGPHAFLLFLSAGVIIGGIAFALSNYGNNGVTTPTTSSTGTGLP